MANEAVDGHRTANPSRSDGKRIEGGSGAPREQPLANRWIPGKGYWHNGYGHRSNRGRKREGRRPHHDNHAELAGRHRKGTYGTRRGHLADGSRISRAGRVPDGT